MDRLERFNRSRGAAALVLAGIFLLLFFCTHETDLIADDYRYCFSYADDSRIVRLAQIFPSMAAHRHSMNGRVAPHFLVQLFLMLPKGVFDLVNAAVFTALVWLIGFTAGRGARPNALLLLTVFGCLWLLQPDFGQVFLWLTGSINYLWCGALCLVWLLPWAANFLRGTGLSTPAQIALALLSLPLGAWSENGTVAMTAMALCFLLLLRLERRQTPPLWMPLSLASLLAGFFYMMLAPAESVNKSAEMRMDVLFANFLENAAYYLRFWPLILSFALLYFLALKRGVERRARFLSLVYVFGSLAGHFVLTFARYTAGRSTYIGLILLLTANALLFVPLWETAHKRSLAALCAVCLVLCVWKGAVGVRDIRRTHYLLQYNEEFIAACAAAGERSVEVYRPYAKTSWSALEGLAYLNTEDPGDWPNVYMAKYYGVDRVIGYEG